MDNFLPENYDVPASGGSYMKFKDGENRFRILASPILGWEYWVSDMDGNRKPLRRRMDKPFTTAEVDEPEKIKHFWAMPVFNYSTKHIEILEITQKGIQKKLRALARDEDWGSPLGYDLVVTKSGQSLETEYEVIAKPAKAVEESVEKAFESMTINLEALYDGGDPFAEDSFEALKKN